MEQGYCLQQSEGERAIVNLSWPGICFPRRRAVHRCCPVLSPHADLEKQALGTLRCDRTYRVTASVRLAMHSFVNILAR